MLSNQVKIYSDYTSWAFSYVARTLAGLKQFLHECPKENSEFPKSITNFIVTYVFSGAAHNRFDKLK